MFFSEKNGIVSDMGVTGEGKVFTGQERKGKRGETGKDEEEEEMNREERRIIHN